MQPSRPATQSPNGPESQEYGSTGTSALFSVDLVMHGKVRIPFGKRTRASVPWALLLDTIYEYSRRLAPVGGNFS